MYTIDAQFVKDGETEEKKKEEVEEEEEDYVYDDPPIDFIADAPDTPSRRVHVMRHVAP